MRPASTLRCAKVSATNVAKFKALYQQFDTANPEYSKVFDTIDFGYRKITVERPLRLNFQVSSERIERLQNESTFQALASSKKRDPEEKAAEEASGRTEQAKIIAALQTIPDDLYKNRPQFERELDAAVKQQGVKLSASVRKAVLNALSERDESAEICIDKNGNKEADSDLRDYEYVPLEYEHDFDPLAHEYVPLKQNIWDYFAREVTPHMPEAWINQDVRDDKDGEIGKVGYEINVNRYFYKYTPPRPLAEIEADIKKLEREIIDMLRDLNN
jgi:type I restriction enzyme M protein